MPDVKIYDREVFPTGIVIVTIFRQVWPLVLFASALAAASLVWFYNSGDGAPARLAWWPFRMVTMGLVGSFALHEFSHVLMLKRIRTITHLGIDSTAWRISVLPFGAMSARQVMGVAAAGPASCLAVGCILWSVDRHLAWWHLSHGIFLLPFFGDGRNLVNGFCGRLDD
jgi:hypothetical protein